VLILLLIGSPELISAVICAAVGERFTNEA